ncbi:MAG: TetR/AcrR family transcriptional regulator [Anaerolineales bacterium]|nr:TetR/AcrR family transcriptional regulator [Anaerolineales bacterium]
MTRDDVLDAAAQVFRQKGFHGASMSDIAAAVNVQKASLYHHVSSKQEILLELLERALQILTVRISTVAEQNDPADKKLRQMIRVYLQLLAENADLSSVLLFEHRSLDKKSHTRHVPQRDKFEALWRDVLNEGVRAKVFDMKDIGLTVRALMGVMNWTLTWYHPGGGKTIDQIADEYADLILNGLLK